MPEVRLGGEIFTLGADAGIDGRWHIFPYEALAGITVGGHLRADLGLTCHQAGISLEARAAATGRAEAASVLRIAAGGQAAAGAGVSAAVGFEVDPFEQLRLGAEIGAWAYARASAHLAIGLDAGHLATLIVEAAGGEDTFPARAGLIVLDELDLRAGAWAGVAAAAMAKARATATLTLSERGSSEPGLTCEVEAALGAGAGGHVHVIAAGRLTDPRRMVGRLSRLTTSELGRLLRDVLPPDSEPAIRFAEFALPIAAQLSFELGERALLDSVGSEDARAKPVVLSVFENLQRFTLAGLLEAADLAIAQLVREVGRSIELGRIGAASAREVRDLVPGLVETLGEVPSILDGDSSAEDALAVVGPPLSQLIDLLTAGLDEDRRREIDRPLAVAWTTLSLVAIMGPAFARARAGATFLGFGAAVGGELRSEVLPPPPELVATEYARVTPSSEQPPRVTDALAYLVAALPGDVLSRVPGLEAFTELLQEHLGIDPSRLLVETLVEGMGDGPGAAAYRMIESFLDAALALYVAPALDAARAELAGPEHEAALAWIEEVIDPAVSGLRDFFLVQVSRFIDGELSPDRLEPFSKAAGQVAYRISVPAAVLVIDQVVGAGLDGLHEGLADLSAGIRSDAAADLTDAFADIVTGQFGLAPSPAVLDAARELAADLAEITGFGFGPDVFTSERRARLRAATNRALADPVGSKLEDAPSWDAWLLRAVDCEAVPALGELEELVDANVELLSAWAKVALPPTALAQSRFFVRVGEAAVNELADEVLAALNRLRQEIHDLAAELASAAREAELALQALTERLRDAAEQAASIVGHIGTDEFRDAFLSALDGVVDDPTDAAYQGARGAIHLGWGLVAAGAAVLEPAIDAAGDAATAITDLAATLAGLLEDVLDLVAGVTAQELTLAGEIALTGPDGVPVLQHLEAASTAYEEARDAATRAREALEEAKRRESEQSSADRPPLAVTIVEPQAFPGGEEAWYGRDVPLTVEVTGASMDWVSHAPRRVRVTINGVPVVIPVSSWNDDGAGLVLNATLGVGPGLPFRFGVNAIEVVAIGAGGSVQRATVGILVDGSRAGAGVLSVDLAESVLNTVGDDHERTPDETVVLRAGARAVDVSGWRVSDRAGHVYRIPDGTNLPARARLRLHTGPRPRSGAPTDSRNDRHLWLGRRAAVWNNRGDSVLVRDASGTVVVVAQYDDVGEPVGGGGAR